MRALVSTVVDQCIKKDIIDESTKNIYIYGGKYLALFVFNIAFPLVIGILGNVFMEMCIFVVGYCTLRRFAGGFHAKSPVTCFVLSQIMILAVYIAIKNSQMIANNIVYISNIISLIIIVLLSPVETKSRPLDAYQKQLFRLKAAAISAAMVVGVALLNNASHGVSIAISLAVSTTALLMVQGLIVK